MLASAYDVQLVPSAMTAIVPAEKPQ
jgi:hypothetical protein